MALNLQPGQASRERVYMRGDESNEPAARVLEIQRYVLTYLLEHPQAKDTAVGILDWWVPDGIRGWRVGEVTSALEQLQTLGWIAASTYGGTTVYGLGRVRRDEMLQWLER